MAKEIKSTVIKTYGAIKTKEYDKSNWETKKVEHHVDTYEVNIIAWGDAEPAIDIRWWTVIDDQEKRATKGGLTFTIDEIEILQFALDQAVVDLGEVLKNWKAA